MKVRHQNSSIYQSIVHPQSWIGSHDQRSNLAPALGPPKGKMARKVDAVWALENRSAPYGDPCILKPKVSRVGCGGTSTRMFRSAFDEVQTLAQG